MFSSFNRLACPLQAEEHLAEQIADRSLAGLKAFCLEINHQTVGVPACPAQVRYQPPSELGSPRASRGARWLDRFCRRRCNSSFSGIKYQFAHLRKVHGIFHLLLCPIKMPCHGADKINFDVGNGLGLREYRVQALQPSCKTFFIILWCWGAKNVVCSSPKHFGSRCDGHQGSSIVVHVFR